MFNPQVEATNSQLKDITEKLNTSFDIGLLAFLFNKSRVFIVLFFLISFFVAFIYLRYSQPIYESTALIQINDADQASDILKLNSGEDNTNLMAEAIEQIKSPVFLRRVVEKLDISVNYFSEGTFKNNELYHSTPYKVQINLKDKYLYGNQLKVEFNPAMTQGKLTAGTTTYTFQTNEWLRNARFDINVYLNERLTPAQIRQIVADNQGFYFTVSEIEHVTAQLKGKLEVKVESEMAKTM